MQRRLQLSQLRSSIRGLTQPIEKSWYHDPWGHIYDWTPESRKLSDQ